MSRFSYIVLALSALSAVVGSSHVEAYYPQQNVPVQTVTVTKYITSCPTSNPQYPVNPQPQPKPTTTPVTGQKPKPSENPQKPAGGSGANQGAQEMLCRVNSLRSKGGLKPLKLDSRLMNAAQKHSVDQNRNKRMSHTGSVIASFSDRIKTEGYSWMGAAENIAWNQKDTQAVMDAWHKSSGHYKNIMGDYECFGWGESNLYWTQNFAKGSACTQSVAPNCPAY